MSAPEEKTLDVPLWRRLAAALYDAMIVIALFMFATALALPFTDGDAVPAGEIWFQVYLLIVGVTFFVGFWYRSGQTLGMRAWKIRLAHADENKPLSAGQLLLRALAALISWACLGLGFWWALFDKHNATWHDKISRSRLLHSRS